jgi:hypothetical protein
MRIVVRGLCANQQFQPYHNPITREFRYRLPANEFEPAVNGTVDRMLATAVQWSQRTDMRLSGRSRRRVSA